jgi:hypothetical protein
MVGHLRVVLHVYACSSTKHPRAGDARRFRGPTLRGLQPGNSSVCETRYPAAVDHGEFPGSLARCSGVELI